MDYNKINNINIDGNENIVLQDVSGQNITVNYNDISEIEKLIEKTGANQMFEIKQLITSQENYSKQLLEIVNNIQKIADQKLIENKAQEALQNVDEILRKFTEKSIIRISERMSNLYELLRNYEDELMLTDDPKLKMKYNKEINDLTEQIDKEKEKLVSIK